MTESVPVSGEDQPGPRIDAVNGLLASSVICRHPQPERSYPVATGSCARCLVEAADAADRAAGIRRVKWPEQPKREVGTWWIADKPGEGQAHLIESIEGDYPGDAVDSLLNYDLRFWFSRCGFKSAFLFSVAASAMTERCATCTESVVQSLRDDSLAAPVPVQEDRP